VARATVIALAAAAGLAACAAPDYHYVRSSSDRTFVRVPENWTLFDEDELLDSSSQSPEQLDQFKQLSWSVGFDARPEPAADSILAPSRFPTGLVQVRTLLPSQRDSFSLADLRSVLLPYDPLGDEAQEGGQVEVLAARNVERPGGFHGSELLLNLTTPDGEVVKWRQVALLDSKVEKVHLLVVTCELGCYDEHESVIDGIVKSWKVEDR
jgi:hypothetical protein